MCCSQRPSSLSLQLKAKGWPDMPSQGSSTLLLGCPLRHGTGLGDVHMHLAMTDMPPWIKARSSKRRSHVTYI